MYYPLLRARQFELIALRDLANEGQTQDVIRPILEPVKGSNTNLNLAYKVFVERGQEVYLIVNPEVGEFRGDNSPYLEYLSSLEHKVFFPAFYYRNNAEYIIAQIQTHALEDCMLICQNDINPSDSDFKELVVLDQIKAINMDDPGRNRQLDRFLKGLNKNYIRRDDLFEKQPRNSNFLDIDEHRFSEEHLYYREETYKGFSDFTVLPSEYSEGGSTPRAVVLHLTYFKNEDQIWIRHFTSETNDSIANIQGKFAEAAQKAVQFCKENNLNNSAIEELMGYFERAHYPGLGTVKKISIKNHLLIVGDYIRRTR